MRRIRMLGLCLVALFAIGALVAGASQAENIPKLFKKFQHCPYNNPEAASCTLGVSSNTSEFKAGNIKVQLSKPITIQGGLHVVEEGPHEGEDEFIAAEGAETLTAVKQPGPSLYEVVDPALLSSSELTRYNKVIRKGGNGWKGYAQIELAGEVSEIYLSSEHLVEEEGPTLTLPVKVKLINKFLGNNCYDGSNEHPIEITLTTGQSGFLHGAAGHLEGVAEGGILEIRDNSLVNNTYEAPAVEGCGVNGGADEAVNAKLGLPAGEGINTTKIDGALYLTSAEETKEFLE